jgi:GR25 family glycosyltransferase involved in LPS biosynthesis
MNFKICTYLILHPSRRDKIDSRWLTDKNINVFDAIVPPKWKSEKIPTCDRDVKQLGAANGWSLSSGEMGCLLSHHAITDKAVREEHEYTLILEDQLIYREGWMGDLQELMCIPDTPPDILTLFQRKWIKGGDPKCKREVVSKDPYLDIVTESEGGQGNTKAWLYSLRAMKWLYNLYNERDFLRAADGYVNKHTIGSHKRNTGEELVWMTTGNYADPELSDHTFFKIYKLTRKGFHPEKGSTIYGRRKVLN